MASKMLMASIYIVIKCYTHAKQSNLSMGRSAVTTGNGNLTSPAAGTDEGPVARAPRLLSVHIVSFLRCQGDSKVRVCIRSAFSVIVKVVSPLKVATLDCVLAAVFVCSMNSVGSQSLLP